MWPRIVLSLVVLAVGGAAIGYFASRNGDDDGVRLVDTREELDRVLREGASVELRDRFGRLPIDEALARTFFAALEDQNRNAYDPLAYFVQRPNFRGTRRMREHPVGEWEVTTDSRGFRRPGEVAAVRPKLRVLVVGDSHVEGVVPVEETLTMRLEGHLTELHGVGAAEVLNASRGGYALYNYLGVLERNLDLEPHVFVMVVYGGNDFAGLLPMHLYFKGRELPPADEDWALDLTLAQRAYGAAIAQGYHQIGYFSRAPEAAELALEGAIEVVRATDRLCNENGIRFVCAYLPPMEAVERERIAERLRPIEEMLRLSPEDIESTERLGDRFLAQLAEEGVETLDLRPALRRNAGALYWKQDHHLATAGHRVVADALFERLTREP